MRKIIAFILFSFVAIGSFNLLPDAVDEDDASIYGEAVPQWSLLSDNTTAAVYNAVPEQCNKDCLHTASMYTIVPENVLSQRILAMERTMMTEYGIHYGDLVLIEGTGYYDGIWQVQDTMNKRFAGQHRIDLCVPQNIRHGKWSDIKIYLPANDAAKEKAREELDRHLRNI